MSVCWDVRKEREIKRERKTGTEEGRAGWILGTLYSEQRKYCHKGLAHVAFDVARPGPSLSNLQQKQKPSKRQAQFVFISRFVDQIDLLQCDIYTLLSGKLTFRRLGLGLLVVQTYDWPFCSVGKRLVQQATFSINHFLQITMSRYICCKDRNESRKDDISLARITKAIHVFSTSWHRRRLFTYPSCGGMVIPFHNYRGRNKDVPI